MESKEYGSKGLKMFIFFFFFGADEKQDAGIDVKIWW